MLRFYNTLTKKKEEFKSLEKGKVKMYNCGPTVYDFAHIGNLRSYITADLIRRYLEYKGYEVRQVKNITDVGHLTNEGLDKIAEVAKRKKRDPYKIAKFYTQKFFEDEKKLNIKPALYFPRATQHIQDMIDLIQILIKKGYAYEAKGNIYFDVFKFKNYGKLSGNTLDKLKIGARLKPVADKKSPYDFTLWLKADSSHLMQWDSPWGKGYPGWHIECSVMSMKYLGETLDIHTGGEDNIFPHHENEISQSEAATGKKFVNYWIHTRFLMVEGKKMSKSLDNFYTLHDLEKKGYNPLDFRFLVLMSHYRSKMDFSEKALKQAIENRKYIQKFTNKINESKGISSQKISPKINDLIKKTKDDFEKYMDDDLNSPMAITSIFNFIKENNKLLDKNKINREKVKQIHSLLMRFDKVLGILEIKKPKKITKEIKELIKQRDEARKSKNWQKADQIREKLKKLGIEIKDTGKGTEWDYI